MIKNYSIKPMKPNDIPQVLAVIASSWNRERAHVAQPDLNAMFNPVGWPPYFYVARNSDAPWQFLGIAGYEVSSLDYGIYELSWVGVAKPYQGEGIGKSLVSVCLKDLEPVASYVMLMTDKPGFYLNNFGFWMAHKMPTADSPDDVLLIKNMMGK